MIDYAYIIFSGFCAVFNVVPTAYHFALGNSGPASFGLWVVVLNASNFINAIVWRDDAVNRAAVLCDISSKLNMVGPIGLLASNFCIIRFIAKIVGFGRTIEDRGAKRRRALFDYGISFAFPLVLAALSLIYQTARYGINRTIGCAPNVALVWPTFLLYLIWPPILCGLSCGYSIYVLYCLSIHHRNLRDLIAKSSTPLNMSRFLRLGGLAATYFAISLPFTIWGMVVALQSFGPYIPFTHWSSIHNQFNRLSDVRLNPIYGKATVGDWLVIAAGLTVLVFFSFASESLAIYMRGARLIGLDRLFPFLRERIPTRASTPTTSGAAPTLISLKSTQWESVSSTSKSRVYGDDESIDMPFQAPLAKPAAVGVQHV